ncbi:MAG: MTH1187 family thiamine-binding protein [Chloroflexota bacterium]|nr:MTH1187 family thiamine-binding protein [Chloroflexota bacterium]
MIDRVIAEVSVVPLGTSTPSVSKYVAACHEILKAAHDIRYQLTPMATVIEGPLDGVLETVRRMHEVPFEMGAMRVVTTLKIDDRRDKVITMESKVSAVEKHSH